MSTGVPGGVTTSNSICAFDARTRGHSAAYCERAALGPITDRRRPLTAPGRLWHASAIMPISSRTPHTTFGTAIQYGNAVALLPRLAKQAAAIPVPRNPRTTARDAIKDRAVRALFTLADPARG